MADLHAVSPATPIVLSHRPWGWYTVLGEPDDDPIAAVKILRVDPGQMLSLQTHELRRERWIPINNGLGAIIGDEEIALKAQCIYEIPAGVQHRLFDKSGLGGSVIEVMYGIYDENDITRLKDMYVR